jgi:two-component system, cell cycle response regulator
MTQHDPDNRDDDEDEEKNDETVIITQKVNLNELRNSVLEPYLIHVSGKDAGLAHKLTDTNTTIKIGRDPTADVVLDDAHVSRFHAEIEIKGPEEIWLRDLKSTNGIFINGVKVEERELRDGDKILVGTRSYFKFCFQDSVDQNYQQNLFNAANIDNLTQCYNKKYFLDILNKEFSYTKRKMQPLSLLMVDIDYFKKINDTYGHIAGDTVLKSVGNFFLKNLRLENFACRYGGEEFAIILRNTPADVALRVAERLRLGIQQGYITHKDKTINTTISLGAATYTGTNFNTPEDFIQYADKNLYIAKEEGRNRTITAPLKKAA